MNTNPFRPTRLLGGLALVVLLALVAPSWAEAAGSTRSKTVALKGRSARKGLSATQIRAAEQRLADLGYWTGPIDGVFDTASRNALIAFQKVEGREPTGRLTAEEVDLLSQAAPPEPLERGFAHVEIDIARQVLSFVELDGQVANALPVSTGSNKVYREKGITDRAYTPRGRFVVESQIRGWRKSPLGLLYYPSYIFNGIAVHGNPQVPTFPDSHGCIRIPMFAAEAAAGLMPPGTIVIVHEGGSFANISTPWPDPEPEKPAEGDSLAVE